MRHSLFIAVAVLLASAAQAQELGKLEFGGREIVLFADGTWKYSDDSSPKPADRSDCTGLIALSSKKLPLSYCLSDRIWQRSDLGADYEASFKHMQYDLYFGVIPETTEIDPLYLEGIILQNAQAAAGLHEVVVRANETAEINGVTWSYLEYATTTQGIPMVAMIYYHSGMFGTVQLVFIVTPQSSYDSVVAFRDAVVATVRISE